MDTNTGDMEKWYPYPSNRISDMNRILADRMQILIEYVKMDTVKNKLNGYTYITFYLLYNYIKWDAYYEYYCVHINTSTVSIVIRLL